MVENGLPLELRNTWQINLDQLQLVLDGRRQPVTLGQGANGTVRDTGALPNMLLGVCPWHLAPDFSQI